MKKKLVKTGIKKKSLHFTSEARAIIERLGKYLTRGGQRL
jgi:hypothetical protein